METPDLFALRKNVSREFPRASDLSAFLNDLFGEQLVFPLVVGYSHFSETDWKIVRLSPSTEATALTIRKYLEGLKQANRASPEDYSGDVIYPAIDAMHRCELDCQILGVRLFYRSNTNQCFNLRLFLAEASSENPRVGYQAVSELPPTELEKTCGRFRGPNRQYKRGEQ